MYVTRIDPALAASQAAAQACLGITDVVMGLIEAIGDTSFAGQVLSRLASLTPADALCAYRVPRGAPPELIMAAATGRGDVTQACWQAYREGLYRQDSSFDVVRSAARRQDLAVSCQRAEEFPHPHRLQIYEAHALQERLSVIATDREDAVIALNLYRLKGSPAFGTSEVGATVAAAPMLMACVRRHYELCLPREACVSADSDPEARLRSRCPALTRREVQVCLGLLRGWTFDGIAIELDVSPTTVKTYRDRAFQRLGIHHRNQLFGLMSA